jgi:ABC-type proline/glycine betaine transport system permease subunit
MRAGRRKASSVIMMVALLDLLVILPYSYWQFSSHRLALAVVAALEAIGVLVLSGIALYLRRRGS